MRFAVLFVITGLVSAQTPDPAFPALTRAFEALKTRDYDTAVSNFLSAIEVAPARASIRKDLAYTYLKVGENILARDQFHEAMNIDPQDTKVAMEFAFLCYETKEQAQARRIFDRIRKTGNAEAETAFQNIDAPLAAGIARWKQAIAGGGDNFSARYDLATLAEQRDELPLAAESYEKAWRHAPDHRSVLVDLGRVLQAMHQDERADAALLAASRGGETRAADMARELLPNRYPYVPEFRRALELDPTNVELRRELGFLLLSMEHNSEAESEFRNLSESTPSDALAATQLGFLLYARGQHDAAMVFFNRILEGKDQDLANRVRALLHMPQVVMGDSSVPKTGNDPMAMAQRSLDAGYMQDALKYLQLAQEADPGDFSVMLKLAWTNNIMRRDTQAVYWFNMARRSSDPKIAREATHAWANLHSEVERFRITAWFYPLFSSRWHDQFGYAQVKAEMRTGWKVMPYLSVRFVGDTRGTLGNSSPGSPPQYLSESSFILGMGLHTVPWNGITGWFEAGTAVGYLSGHMLPDYRGGVSAARGYGQTLGGQANGFFADSTLDAIFVSRFGNDFLLYSQSRAGYTFGPHDLRAQLYLNANATVDTQAQYWANFVEVGPGMRIHSAAMPAGMYFTVNLLRGAYLINLDNPRRPNFTDLRVGAWYAFTR